MASEVSKTHCLASIISMTIRSLKFLIPLDKVFEISNTIGPLVSFPGPTIKEGKGLVCSDLHIYHVEIINYCIGNYHVLCVVFKVIVRAVLYHIYKQGGSLCSPPACTCVCLHVLVRDMVWNSLCIPCMDSSPTMSR